MTGGNPLDLKKMPNYCLMFKNISKNNIFYV